MHAFVEQLFSAMNILSDTGMEMEHAIGQPSVFRDLTFIFTLGFEFVLHSLAPRLVVRGSPITAIDPPRRHTHASLAYILDDPMFES